MTPDETVKEEPGGQMSFLDHLDELRKRVVRAVGILVIAFFVCYAFSDSIYRFLEIPIRKALSEASRRELPANGISGTESILPLADLTEGKEGRYIFDRSTQLGGALVSSGASVNAKVARDSDGKLGLFTTESLITNNAIVPAGVRLPIEFGEVARATDNSDERLIVTTAQEQFTLFVTVSLYSAIALSMPLLLWQIWGFISPALYRHERRYVTPFIALSSTAFIGGAAFGYYILFPPAARYLLGLGGGEFQLLLRASEYFDLITIIMLAMGVIFQMPAITYVLARIGLVSAGLLVRSWKISLVVILIIAAVVSPTGDIPNMMLFAAPMFLLYIVSIFIAWFFGKRRKTDAEAAL
ncbi:MAG TPA: twin-arginine translocase subunit TatC [Pyrinomonadaceae bacterium]|jgi:sec-independent protein translocase protein TatC|nr:twin-arginine translocase subunit TatC [Pyrinomonadaceae bacterium]